MDASDRMVARISTSAFTTGNTTNSRLDAEPVKNSQVPANQEAQQTRIHAAVKETPMTEVIDTEESSTPPVTRRDVKDTWFISIASLASKDIADRFMLRATEKGIEATQKQVFVNGKKYWRISVRGFSSSAEARSHATLVKDLLGLNKVWIGKDSG